MESYVDLYLKDDRGDIYAPMGVCPFWVGVKVSECKGINPHKGECGYKAPEAEKCSIAGGVASDKPNRALTPS